MSNNAYDSSLLCSLNIGWWIGTALLFVVKPSLFIIPVQVTVPSFIPIDLVIVNGLAQAA